MTLLLIYGFVAIGVSFFCSVLEAVLLSITPSYVRATIENNPVAGKRIEKLKERVDQPLAAILTLNTIAHTAGAAGVGAQAAALYGDTAIGIASAIMTLLVLFLSEIIPKTLGANHWRSLAPLVSYFLIIMVKVLAPFIWLSDQITKLFSKKDDDQSHVRAEIEAMAMLGSQVGALDDHETEIIKGLLKFQHTQIREVMTPRKQIFRISKDMSVERFCKEHGSVPYSRVLVYDDNPDDIIGYVFKTDVILANVRVKPNYRIGKLTKKLYIVSTNMSLPALFNKMLTKRVHMSLVVDEYGEVSGIVTLEDLLETMLQVHIFDEKDSNPRTETNDESANPEMYSDEDQDHSHDKNYDEEEDQNEGSGAEDKNVSGTN
jgi:CBS domain containing-hemolysin-like protein